jgi:hypothetical protein
LANTVEKNKQGPVWILGNIAVATPGTPVGIMSLVDPSSVNDPNNPTSTTSDEYTVRAYQILFQPSKAGASHGLQQNTGNIYIIKRGAGAGSGNRDDLGVVIVTLTQGAASSMPLPFALTAAPLDRNVFNPYDFLIDADTPADGAQVTLVIM